MAAAGIQKLCGLMGALGKEWGWSGLGRGDKPALHPHFNQGSRWGSSASRRKSDQRGPQRAGPRGHHISLRTAKQPLDLTGRTSCVQTSVMVREKMPGWEAGWDGRCQQRVRKTRIHVSTNSKHPQEPVNSANTGSWGWRKETTTNH